MAGHPDRGRDGAAERAHACPASLRRNANPLEGTHVVQCLRAYAPRHAYAAFIRDCISSGDTSSFRVARCHR